MTTLKNPKAALAALNLAPVKVGAYTVYPLTLGMTSVLEALDSPLSTGRATANALEWAPTLYALTRPPAESRSLIAMQGLKGYSDLATEWADEDVASEDAARLLQAVREMVFKDNAVMPDSSGDVDDPEDEEAVAPNPTAATRTAG